MTWRVLMLGTAAAALTLTFGAAAFAEEGAEIDYNRLGGYVQFAGVKSFANFSGELDGASGGGFSFRLGNRFHQYLALEFQYEFTNQRGVQARSMAAMERLGVWQTDIYTHQITFNFRTYPWSSEDGGIFRPLFDGRLQPYALTGIGVSIVDTPEGDGVGFVARLGVGFDVYLTQNVVVSLEGAYALSAGGAGGGAPTTGLDALPIEGRLSLQDLDQISLGMGVAYRF